MDYELLKKINKGLKKTNIKGKDYVDVANRIQAFRQMYPEGCIETEMLSDENGVVKFKATVRTEDGRLLATGHASENQNASMINKTSYIENCETSAIGRALGNLGIGSTQSIASVEELTSAMAAQEVIVQTDKVIDAIIDIAGGDRERVNTYVGNLFPGNRLEDLDYETLVRLKKDIAKKMLAQTTEAISNFNITRRAK
ncbi:MAG: hypothetical protein II265_03650 [Clostridia bacterium]|nr:hypothetical protein [Clostridia bacterium]